ncbi:unnamed protein product [Calypogeia fissa]
MAPSREMVVTGNTEPNGGGAMMTREAVVAMQELTKAAFARKDSPLIWAVDIFSLPGSIYPNLELGTILLNQSLSQPGRGPAWMYLQHALAAHLIDPFLTLGILTARVIPVRQQHPDMYQMYLELSNNFVFRIGTTKSASFRERSMKYVDEALQLSQMGESPITEFGTCMAYFLFTLVNRLTDAISEDWKSPSPWNDKQTMSASAMHGQLSHGVTDMEDDAEDKEQMKKQEKEQTKKSNSLLALELVAKIMQNKRTAALLRLARRILPDQWSVFARTLHTLELLTRNKLSSVPKEAPEALGNLAAAIQQGLYREWRPTQLPVIQALMDSGSRTSSFGDGWGVGTLSSWLPLDIYMEAAMEKQRLHVQSPSATIADMMKTLQAIQGASWHEVFLATWTAALRLTHRDRDWVEGPKPHIESRMCMLLSHVPLACLMLVEEEEKGPSGNGNMRGENMSTSNGSESEKERLSQCVRRAGNILSLQVLGQFEALLYPPKIAIVAANQAAASIASVLGNLNANAGLANDPSAMPKVTVGNMRHLIVEACISRGLLDTTAYFWINKTGSGGSLSPPNPPQSSPWAAFMEGAPLSASLTNALVSSPAGSLAELEKAYQVAINGPDEERAAAASILCGASLSRSWNVQEHAVRLAVKLLSPPMGPDNRGSGSHLIAYGPMLYQVLDSMTSVDVLNILALYGMFPELAASLLPICEVYGSLQPSVPRSTSPGEDVYKIFSLAFLLLLRLWKFHRPPLEHCLLGSGPGLGADLSLEYLLQIRGMQMAGCGSYGDKNCSKDPLADPMQGKRLSPLSPSYSHSMSSIRSPLPSTPTAMSQPVTLDSFPKLKAWYTQHQACIASTLSGIVRGNPVHQVADRLLNIMFKKFSKNSSGSQSSGSGGHGGDDKPVLPAWDVIAAVPFVVEEVFTACSHGRLTPRDLTTGLRDLIDFLPATMASFVSCCGAEVYRGLYKPASMNGNDWPSPAANLFAVEGEIQDLLASSGVIIPGLVTGTVGGNAPASLPLPLAALVSLTITFKLDRQSDAVLSVAGPGLETASSAGPWPSMAVVAALWTQKMRRWHDFIVFNTTVSIFKQNKPAFSQLLRSCFSALLCTTSSLTSKLQGHGGVGALLGHGHWLPSSPGISSLAPGTLYLRAFPTLHDIIFVSDELLSLVAESSRDMAVQGLSEKDSEGVSHPKLKSAHPSLGSAIARAAQASTLGASFLTVAGGATLVRKLYLESVPTWLLSGRTKATDGTKQQESRGTILEGYAIARFVLLSGALAWGTSAKIVPSSSQYGANPGIASGMPVEMRRQHVLGLHLELLASGLDGKISINCKHTTWKAYVIGFIALMVTCTPNWISDVKVETLQRLATGLRWWHQHELAFALLERGGPAAVGAAAELAMGSIG